jgi:hypothetical protein
MTIVVGVVSLIAIVGWLLFLREVARARNAPPVVEDPELPMERIGSTRFTNAMNAIPRTRVSTTRDLVREFERSHAEPILKEN